jgi:EF hand
MEADQDNDGKISFDEFKKMVENTDVSMSMTLGGFALLPSFPVSRFPSNCFFPNCPSFPPRRSCSCANVG